MELSPVCTEAAQAAESYTSFYQQKIQRSCVTVKVMLNVSSTGLVGPQPEDIRPDGIMENPKKSIMAAVEPAGVCNMFWKGTAGYEQKNAGGQRTWR